MKILAIETSCDETAISVVEASGFKASLKFKVLAHIVSSQTKIHAPFGGVVPRLARREHEKNLVPVLDQALSKSKLKNYPSRRSRDGRKNLERILEREPGLLRQLLLYLNKIKKPKIDLLAVTVGPGLEPALWVGINFARALSAAWDLPLQPINHLEGHIASVLIAPSNKYQVKSNNQLIKFPALALIISGGHTELVLIRKWGQYQVIGQTRDDAVGEAFDKVARLLGLPYPGGPQISNLANKAKEANKLIKLPRPMLNSKDHDFSFSGLKTAVLYLLPKLGKLTTSKIAAVAKEFQNAVIEVLVKKTMRAAKEYKVKILIIGGGVIANTALRAAFEQATQDSHLSLLIPHLSLTTDNATMIALAAYLQTNKASLANKLIKLEARGGLMLK